MWRAYCTKSEVKVLIKGLKEKFEKRLLLSEIYDIIILMPVCPVFNKYITKELYYEIRLF